jgi:hypothetical protein
MNAVLQTCHSVQLPESQVGLQQALRTLRGIRRRYEIDCRNSDVPFRSVCVALNCADMVWVAAAIEALDKAIAAGPAIKARPET